MATTKSIDVPPKKNFILRNKLNISKLNGRNSAPVTTLNENKGIGSGLEKLNLSGKRSTLLKNQNSMVQNVSKLKLEKSNFSVDESEGRKFEEDSDPLRSPSPDYTMFAALNIGKSYTSKAMQTINITNQEALLENSIIRFPSAKARPSSLVAHKNEFFEPAHLTRIKKDMVRTRSLDGNDSTSVTTDKSDISKFTINEASTQELANHRQSRAIKVLKSPNLLKPYKEPETFDPFKAPPTYKLGALPKYLKSRRNPARNNDWDDICPEGHVTLPDSERKDTLNVLRNRYATLVSELNKMPVRLPNLQDKRKKQLLEEELLSVEDGINVFSRPRVYVKLNT